MGRSFCLRLHFRQRRFVAACAHVQDRWQDQVIGSSTAVTGVGMKSLDQLPYGQVTTVFTDIDDTLTTDGKLSAQAYTALETLQRAGLRVIPVTGRPAGWCDQIARMWPVDGIIGENGALYMWHDPVSRKMHTRHLLDVDS